MFCAFPNKKESQNFLFCSVWVRYQAGQGVWQQQPADARLRDKEFAQMRLKSSPNVLILRSPSRNLGHSRTLAFGDTL